MSKNYRHFHSHLKQFGLGMFVVPPLVARLRGEFFIEAEAPPSSGLSRSDNSWLEHDDLVKIGFCIPIEMNTMNTEIMEPQRTYAKKSYSIQNTLSAKSTEKSKIFLTPGLKGDTMRQISRAAQHNSTVTSRNCRVMRNFSPEDGSSSPEPPSLGNTVRRNNLERTLQNPSSERLRYGNPFQEIASSEVDPHHVMSRFDTHTGLNASLKESNFRQ